MVLNDKQRLEFCSQGFTIVEDCFPVEAASTMVGEFYSEVGYDPEIPSTWKKDLVFHDPQKTVLVKDFSPRLYSAICEIIGGEDRLGAEPTMGRWVVNFRRGFDKPWRPPSAIVHGWHVDGDFYVHFLDSPELGLLVIPLFSNVAHRGGGTTLAADSLPVVANYLNRNRAGVVQPECAGFSPGKTTFDYAELVSACSDFRELTGKVGDVALIHPMLLHNFSQNHSGIPRIITNIAVQLEKPMLFDRQANTEFSLVEAAILNAIDVDRLHYFPEAKREMTVALYR